MVRIHRGWSKSKIFRCLVVTGTMEFFMTFPSYWEQQNPNWLFFRGVGQPPTSWVTIWVKAPSMRHAGCRLLMFLRYGWALSRAQGWSLREPNYIDLTKTSLEWWVGLANYPKTLGTFEFGLSLHLVQIQTYEWDTIHSLLMFIGWYSIWSTSTYRCFWFFHG